MSNRHIIAKFLLVYTSMKSLKSKEIVILQEVCLFHFIFYRSAFSFRANPFMKFL